VSSDADFLNGTMKIPIIWSLIQTDKKRRSLVVLLEDGDWM
jgi:hypothetical protein